jgi:hypothetical protein
MSHNLFPYNSVSSGLPFPCITSLTLLYKSFDAVQCDVSDILSEVAIFSFQISGVLMVGRFNLRESQLFCSYCRLLIFKVGSVFGWYRANQNEGIEKTCLK